MQQQSKNLISLGLTTNTELVLKKKGVISMTPFLFLEYKTLIVTIDK